MSDKTTKAELYKMLAEAVRNTQPILAAKTPPIVDMRAKRRRQPSKALSIPKKTAKNKGVGRTANRHK